MSTISQTKWLNYVQQYFSVSFGGFSILTSVVGTIIIAANPKLRTSYPFFLALCITDGLISLSYVLMGAYRISLNDQNSLSSIVNPTVCLRQPFVYIYYGASEFGAIISVMVSMERLMSIYKPDWFKANWTLRLSRMMIAGGCFYSAISLVLCVLATLDMARQRQTTAAACYYGSMGGPIYATYHFLFLVALSTLAVAIGIASFFSAKAKIQQLRANSKSFLVMLKQLNSELRHIIVVLVLNMVTYSLSICTNVIYLCSAAGWGKFNWNTVGGKAVTSCYCLSCGLTIFILIAMKSDIRRQFIQLLRFRCHTNDNNSITVRPAPPTTIF